MLPVQSRARSSDGRHGCGFQARRVERYSEGAREHGECEAHRPAISPLGTSRFMRRQQFRGFLAQRRPKPAFWGRDSDTGGQVSTVNSYRSPSRSHGAGILSDLRSVLERRKSGGQKNVLEGPIRVSSCFRRFASDMQWHGRANQCAASRLRLDRKLSENQFESFSHASKPQPFTFQSLFPIKSDATISYTQLQLLRPVTDRNFESTRSTMFDGVLQSFLENAKKAESNFSRQVFGNCGGLKVNFDILLLGKLPTEAGGSRDNPPILQF